ncbi:MAG: DUF1045 domain-containing protein [Pseudomonadota bacterium]|nr:DUF1045 domain-containing protein [Pseudomonadota bacterium]
MTYSRYAIYYTTGPGPLSDFAAAWLGWDIETGTPRAHPDLPGLPLAIDKITQTPRKYGFHATIKPPFRLAPGRTGDELLRDARALVASQGRVTLDGLSLSQRGRFLALTVTGETEALNTLAATMVRDLDHFRAPATQDELTRRRAARLSPRQDALLLDWGYPYVFEEFRFHMTLSGKLSEDVMPAVRDRLRIALDPLLQGPVTIGTLSLAGERPDKMFEILEHLPLSPAKQGASG